MARVPGPMTPRALLVTFALLLAGSSGVALAAPEDAEPFDPEETTQPCSSLEFRSPLVTDPRGLALGWETRAIDVVVLADPYFVAAHPSDWTALLTDLVADASVHYEEQFGLELRIVLIDHLPEGSIDSSYESDEIRPVGRGYINTFYPGLEFDFVAIILGADYAGTTAGQVDCVGGAYTQDTAYLWAEYTDDRGAFDFFGVDMFRDTPLKVFMHEGAHLFGAHHHYSNCGEAMVDYGTDDSLAVCDTMIHDIGLASFRFSPTNRLVVRSFVEEWNL